MDRRAFLQRTIAGFGALAFMPTEFKSLVYEPAYFDHGAPAAIVAAEDVTSLMGMTRVVFDAMVTALGNHPRELSETVTDGYRRGDILLERRPNPDGPFINVVRRTFTTIAGYGFTLPHGVDVDANLLQIAGRDMAQTFIAEQAYWVGEMYIPANPGIEQGQRLTSKEKALSVRGMLAYDIRMDLMTVRFDALGGPA